MFLTLDGKYSTQFILKLLDRMEEWFWQNVDLKRMQLVENYLNILYPMDREPLTAKEICQFAMDNLTTKPDKGCVKIMFDETIPLKNYPVRLIDVIDLINFGNREIPPYPIFSEMFDYVADNFSYFEFVANL